MREFHNRYGKAVRYAPAEVSFITSTAWKDIYGHGHHDLPKALVLDPEQTPDILNADGPDHSRFRKALSHAFSDRGLREQEPLIKVHIDLLMAKLDDFATSGAPTDMVKWYNLTTFDIIGDLAFGEPFGGLKMSDYHSWFKNTFSALKFIPFLQFMQQYQLLAKIVEAFMPKNLKEGRIQQQEFARKTAMGRVNRTELHGRGDFMDSMLKHRNDKDGLSDSELVSNANVLIIAGSETTATLLSGVTFWLLKTPEALAKVTDEVCSAFKSEDEIDFRSATAKLPYMLACLNEALRIYPPVPTNIPRRCPPGVSVRVDGLEIPPGTLLSVHHSAAYWSSLNFHKPRSFLPERWLPPASTDPSSPFYNDNRAVVQPFSVGPRNCIGRNLAFNEMRVILARLLWNFDLELCEESLNWEKHKTYILWEKPDLMCRLKKRKRGGDDAL
ncbi:MAG: hypothetical protein M1834_005568 [Cirrosporium novae-zelandiae]|nr:MAG: hypothetical protein M1834_005568 [Cirrosporium novae-zelandiae]